MAFCQTPLEFIRKSMKAISKQWYAALGPGLITAALVFGPSKMTITSKLGADYGYSLLWIILVAIFFMIVFTAMSARIGRVAEDTLLGCIRKKWGRGVGIITGVGIFLVCASFQAGNSIGVGISLAEATHTSAQIWILLFTGIGVCLLFFRSFYKVLERLMIGFVLLMLLSFFTTLFFARPSLSAIGSGFIPSIPGGSGILVIAFLASCFSIVGAFYQSYLVQEKKKMAGNNPAFRVDSITGMLVLGLMSGVVLVCAAAVLHPRGIKVNAAADMARALEPLFGRYAAILFLTGLFGASFSSLIGNATVGGALLGDALGYGAQLSAKPVKYLIALVMGVGALVAICFGRLPLELIVLAQSVTVFLVPFIGIAMLAVASDASIMGTEANSRTVNLIATAGIALLLFLAASNFKTLFID